LVPAAVGFSFSKYGFNSNGYHHFSGRRLWAAWRSTSFASGPIAGSLSAGIAAITSIAGTAIILAIWHSPQIMDGIRASGGFEEVVGLPLMMVLPGALFGAFGGVAGAGLRRLPPFCNPSHQNRNPEA